jgi:hypothetical protein
VERPQLLHRSLPLANAARTSASASPAPEQRCILDDYATQSVSAFRVEENYGIGNYTALKGARSTSQRSTA